MTKGETPTTTAHIRSMVARRWRERDLRGVYFWGSWLMFRLHVIPLVAAAGAAVGSFVFFGWVGGS